MDKLSHISSGYIPIVQIQVNAENIVENNQIRVC